MNTATAMWRPSEFLAANMNLRSFPRKLAVSVKTSNVPQGVLIADADASNLRLVSRIIQDEGFNVVPARDGREARRILQSRSDITAAIIEGLLPHVSGLDLIKYMKNEEQLKDIPIIVMTRASSVRLSCESMAAGATVVVPEPFSITQLQNLIHMLVDGDRIASQPMVH